MRAGECELESASWRVRAGECELESASWRVRAGECEPVIYTFVRGDIKVKLIKQKRNLRNNSDRREVYVNDDLTPIRRKTVCTFNQNRDFKYKIKLSYS